jgi:hypothetical protein
MICFIRSAWVVEICASWYWHLSICFQHNSNLLSFGDCSVVLTAYHNNSREFWFSLKNTYLNKFVPFYLMYLIHLVQGWENNGEKFTPAVFWCCMASVITVWGFRKEWHESKIKLLVIKAKLSSKYFYIHVFCNNAFTCVVTKYSYSFINSSVLQK